MSAKLKDEPLYKALASELKNGILTGRLKNGERLPSKRAMSSEKQLSLITVQNAYELLCAEGYLKSEERRGYFVSYSGKLMSDDIPPVKLPDTSKPRYDFKSSSTAAEGFPFYTWTRIMRETLSEKDTRLLAAIDPKGVYELRREISKRLAITRGIYCSPEQIIIGAGSEYLVGLVYQLLGRHSYAFENPGFTKAAKIYQRLGASLDFIATDSEGIRTDLISANKSLEVVHVTPSHSFPLGTVMSPQRRFELLEWVSDAPERRIVEDDFDSEFRYDGHSYPSLYSLDKSDSVIYMNTFTRTLAPSMRIGYMVLPPKLLAKFEQSFMFYSSTVPALEQYVLARFIADGSFERHINRMRKIYRSRRDTLIDALNAEFGGKIDILGKEAGVHLLIRLHGDLNESDIIDRAKNAGILLSGISEFTPEGSGDIIFSNALVINFAGISDSDIKAAVKLLANII
ncbi:MAG: PLP-dependent aminotransferase family protein [Clostridiales bacterium]|nr:PLP-dependent aminotransferase family protein [Clostridiales bacterium]